METQRDLARDQSQLETLRSQVESSFSKLSQRVSETLKYRQPPRASPPADEEDLLDEETAKEISRALKQSELQTRLDMHQ